MKRLTRIVINGKRYDSVDQMPSEVRQQYLEVMGSLDKANPAGLPQVINQTSSSEVVVQESIVYNGKEYNSRDDLPPEARQLFDQLPSLQERQTQPEQVLEVKRTKVFPPEVIVTERRYGADGGASNLGATRFVVAALVVIILVLLALWLAGIKPGDFWRR